MQWHYFQLLQNEQRDGRERAAAEAAARCPQNPRSPPPPPMYLNHNDVAAMEPRTLKFNPYNPGQNHENQINGKRKTADELEAFQEKIRRERFVGLREEFTVWAFFVSAVLYGAWYWSFLCLPSYVKCFISF
jgi:hypothetical protein